MRYQRHIATKKSIKRKIIYSVVFFLIIVIIICIRIRPILKSLTAVQAEYISGKAIDAAASEVLSRNDINYDKLITINSLNDGTVCSMTANIQEMNKFKTEISEEVQKKLSDNQNREVAIPIGTLTGIDILSGRGPKIKIKLELYGNVLTELKSEFEGAGINQTRHRIICNVSVNVSAIIPGCSSYTSVNNSFAVSETVLLGKVPESFTNVDTTDSIYDDINNFVN